jgi:endo-1,4-beta-xylanase
MEIYFKHNSKIIRVVFILKNSFDTLNFLHCNNYLNTLVMRFYIFISCLFSLQSLFGQDQYHNDLINQLSTVYKIEGSTYCLNNTETANLSGLGNYGNIVVTNVNVSNQKFTKSRIYDVKSVGEFPYSSGINIKNKVAIEKDDILLLCFWGKRNSITSEVNVFGENATTYDKLIYQALSISPEWTQYFIPMKAGQNFAVNGLSLGFHTGVQIQNFEIAGFTLLNFKKKYAIKDFPTSIEVDEYIPANAEWKAKIDKRIDEVRKSNLTIVVKDLNNKLVEGATVAIDMKRHAFGFGSALQGCKIPGNKCYDATYIDKISNLDGNGHGFNVGVSENDLKWDAWESQWSGTNSEIIKSIAFFDSKGIKMRGHNLVWPGLSLMPADIKANSTNAAYVRNRIRNRVESMINHPELSKYIKEWDVFNEVTTNRDVEYIFDKDPTLKKGRDFYGEIMTLVRVKSPNTIRYMNDYVIDSYGGSTKNLIDRFKLFMTEIDSMLTSYDAIGFQCHAGPQLISMDKMEGIFNEFYLKQKKRMSVTEYDMSKAVDPQIQAAYLDDLLSLTFSYPGMDNFIMWGFHDGNHWLNNAPIFNLDWSLKPSGKVFIDKVFKKWWTNDSKPTDKDGIAAFRGFKGEYSVTITKDGKSKVVPVLLNNNKGIEIKLDITAIDDLEIKDNLKVYPNPTSDFINYSTNLICNPCSITYYNMEGKILNKFETDQQSGKLDVQNYKGNIMFEMTNSSSSQRKSIIIK